MRVYLGVVFEYGALGRRAGPEIWSRTGKGDVVEEEEYVNEFPYL